MPDPPLASFVDRFWYASGLDADHTWERVLPTGAMQLVVNLRDDAIVIRTGSQTGSPTTLSGAVQEERGVVDNFGLMMQLGAAPDAA